MPAATLATAATEQFFDDIKDALASDKALRLLFGVPSLAFAIDTTGSMEDIIDTVRSEAIEVATSLIGTDDEPGLYIVSPFNDPDVGPITVTSDFEVFQDAINGLFASGGGDCPELSIAGMQAAVDMMDQGSTLLMFTDAAPKDSDAAGTLSTDATNKNIQINIYKYDSDCDDSSDSLSKRQDADSDKYYSEISAVTGGQYHTGPRTDVSKISTVLKNVITANPVSILRAGSSLAGGSDTFSIPADSYTTQLSIALLATGFEISITQPDGTLLTATSDGVTWNTFTTSVSITIPAPVHGTYTVVVSGTGSYTLNANGISALQLSSFYFASVGGRPGHTGWYPLTGPPPYNQQIGATAQIAGAFQTAEFSFRAPSFDLLSTAPMTAGAGEPGYPAANDFFAILTVPNQSFFVYVSGTDDKGFAYQRVLETPITPILATTPFPLAGNQTFNLLSNGTSTNITIPVNVTSSTSKWDNSTISKTTSASINIYSTTPTYLLSTSTILKTNIYTITSCAPEVLNCPARVTTETISISTTVCPVSLSTSTAYTTTKYVVTECPNLAGSCPGLGSSTTRVIPESRVVVAVPLTGTVSAAPTETAVERGSSVAGGSKAGTGSVAAPTTTPTFVAVSGAKDTKKMDVMAALCLGLVVVAVL